MNIVRYTLEVGKELTPEEHAAIASRIDAVSEKPYTYDPDCPLLTPEQLAEFRPVQDKQPVLDSFVGITAGNPVSLEEARKEQLYT